MSHPTIFYYPNSRIIDVLLTIGHHILIRTGGESMEANLQEFVRSPSAQSASLERPVVNTAGGDIRDSQLSLPSSPLYITTYPKYPHS